MQAQVRKTIVFWTVFLSLSVLQVRVAVSQTSYSVASHLRECYFAIADDDVEKLSKIVPAHIPVDWIDPGSGRTILCVAMSEEGKRFPLKCVHYLIENGANVNLGFSFVDDYFSPIRLCHRAETNALQVAEWLFGAGASFVDEKLTDRICLRRALRNRELFDYYLSKGARAELLLPLHPLRRKQETYYSPILEESFSATGVSIEMFEHVYQLMPKQVGILNPTLGLYNYFLCENDEDHSETEEERKNQRDKMQFLIAHGFDTNACFECRIYGSARKATFSEHLKRWNVQGILEKQVLEKDIKKSGKVK